MQNLELTKSEKKELEKRWFLIKWNYSFKDFVETIFYSLMYLLIWVLPYMLIIWFAFIFIEYFPRVVMTLFALTFIIFISPIIAFLFTYILSWTIFYSSKGIIHLGSITKTYNTTAYKCLFFLPHLADKMRRSKEWWFGLYVWWILLTIGTYIGSVLLQLNDNTSILFACMKTCFYMVGSVWSLYIFLEIPRRTLQFFHPLYAFWNLWEKIQKLTPRIEEESKQIQKNFQKDMNFWVLSDWFDTLSSTFSDSISLVIKLEKVEQRANKGNLFDSEKYINSLRSDIIEPLKSLRIFLEKQKTKLIESYKELSKVRVRVGWSGKQDSGIKPEWQEWGLQKLDSVTSMQWQKQDSKSNMEWQEHSGWQEQIELSSKRSESLIAELTENIEKLEVMIEKLGE